MGAILLRSRIIRGEKCINHHIHSSIWSSIKGKVQVIKGNSSYVIGDGTSVNFWRDIWWGCHSIAQTLQIPDDIAFQLEAKFSDFIVQDHWHIPTDLALLFPNLQLLVEQVTIPLDPKADCLAWLGSGY
ncbi:hypothetical protein TSUD_61950 [Trifolium subterraneum]|uniref:Reverse transcriptase zinc-binding domain-containing protein n=1 Tax=Trifolium subterraneum TaxID=3900 RepID=A0A2Z6N0N5_TRISU|nr:hypothetical protein TSUD_61950 [Trifolium subterraneum]